MSTIRRDLSIGDAPTAALAALGLTVAGSLAGLFGAVGVQNVAALALGTVPDALYLVTSRGVQVGFGLFALAYLRYTGAWERCARFRRPSARDAAGVVAALVAVTVLGLAIGVLVSALGLPNESVTGSRHRELALATRPLLWPVAFVAWFGFAAPAEELLYRGIVQGRLREAFSTPAVVALSGVCFALSHAGFSALSGAGGPAIAATGIRLFGAGLVFGGLYEATDNLWAVATFHALSWLGPLHVLASLFGGLP